jgi:Ribbon-helix-helix protein, copG family
MDDERQRVTVVLDRDIAEALERQARAERGSKSGVCRRVLSQWAEGREQRPVAA